MTGIDSTTILNAKTLKDKEEKCYNTDCKEDGYSCDECTPNKVTIIEDFYKQKIDGNKSIIIDKTFSTRLQELLDDIRRLLMDKRHDYGNSYEIIREKYGEKVPLIRLGDKISRLEKLILETHEVVMNEPIEDTYMDIIGYCILELLYRKNAERDYGI